MVIFDARFAAAWTTGNGGSMHFDDIGCMLGERADRRPPAGTRYLVHDYETEQWLEADTAAYVIAPAIRTPMSFGIAALGSHQAADRLARKVGSHITAWAHLDHELEAARAS